ncbi:MAG: carboxypeptidase regulatory-like domain-containing protein, partial [Acidobacteriota bacterium]|nr:carboxypeptidase regulatory-like domain-containing protein [Acidobacteriota bacterium]
MTRTPLLPRFSPLKRGFRRAGPLAVCLAFATAAWAHPTISGTVVIAETGEPAQDAEVVLIETDQVVHTDNAGRFAFVDVDHIGSVTLHVDLGFLSAVRTVAIDIDQEE